MAVWFTTCLCVMRTRSVCAFWTVYAFWILFPSTCLDYAYPPVCDISTDCPALTTALDRSSVQFHVYPSEMAIYKVSRIQLLTFRHAFSGFVLAVVVVTLRLMNMHKNICIIIGLVSTFIHHHESYLLNKYLTVLHGHLINDNSVLSFFNLLSK